MAFDSFKLAKVAHGDLAYHDSGSGEPLILHHGGESHKGQYSVFAPHLADGIWGISYDQRDIADSFGADEPYSMADLADDCVQLMDALEIEKAHIMGISFGGALTLNIGIRHPDRVQTLMVGAAPATFKNGSAFSEKLFAASTEERTDLMVTAVLSEKGQQDPAMFAAVRQVVSGRYTRPGSHRMGALADHDVTDRLDQIVAPTLLFYGEMDPLVTVDKGHELAAAITGAELVVIPEARHGLSFEFKEQTAALVSDFVLSHPIFQP